jgi:ABC-type molybdenum transport system ATPase subunit/photorepair protein PhrA
MIKIKIAQKFKSIGICEFELEEFNVITGKNGSGKSHLLEAILKAKDQSNTIDANHRILYPITINERSIKNIVRVGFGELNPEVTEKCSPTEIKNFIKSAYQYATGQNKSPSNKGVPFFVQFVRNEKIKKGNTPLVEQDFIDNFSVKFMGHDNLLAGRFALIFKSYQIKQDENNYRRFRQNEGYNVTGTVLTDKVFKQTFGMPPWELVNNIFRRVGIPYETNNPVSDDRDSDFSLVLKDRTNPDTIIRCADLSTGEKVLFSLAMAIYNSDKDVQKPDLLLLDEPDAGLHPSMSKNLIDILKEFIVEKSGIPVILTTHSPTTLAALNNEAIYEKNRGTDIPQRTTKENAISILTEDIPFLTVSMEKRRAVFVESQYDEDIYQQLAEYWKQDLKAEPHFFQSSNSGSNCDDVRTKIRQLVDESGMTTIYGIIDGDSKAQSNGNLLVLGEAMRYSIENYILDPLLMGLFLIDIGKKNFIDFGIDKNYTKYDFKEKLEHDEAQKIVTSVLDQIDLPIKDNEVNYSLCNDWELSISEEFCIIQGHKLEELYKEKFPFLKTFNTDKQNDKNLKLQVIKSLKGLEKFIPKDLFDTLLKIQ